MATYILKCIMLVNFNVTSKHKTSNTSRILNEVKIENDTLMLVLADLRREGVTHIVYFTSDYILCTIVRSD